MRRASTAARLIATVTVVIVGGALLAGCRLKDTVEVAAGSGFTCAVADDGTVRCWGANTTGQLGIGTMTDESSPVLVQDLANVVEVAAGYDHACAVRSDGQVFCWGDNTHGQFGDGSKIGSTVPVPTFKGSAIEQLAAGDDHTCALLDNGTVRCWGRNDEGQLGDGSTNDSSRPTVVPGLTGVSQIDAGGGSTCALLDDGSVTCWGDGQPQPVAIAGVTDAEQLDVGDSTSCAVLDDSTVSCWSAFAPIPAVEGLTDAVEVGVGQEFACARRNGGTVECWGSNIEGQLGNEDPNVEFVDLPTPVVGLTGATALSVGVGHSCAVIEDTSTRCWGMNPSGGLGDGTFANEWRATRVGWARPLEGATQLSVSPVMVNDFDPRGPTGTCALLDDGRISCWGVFLSDWLRIGTVFTATAEPGPDLDDVVQLVNTGDAVCGLIDDGTVECAEAIQYEGWAPPVPVVGIEDAVQLTAGEAHLCALIDDGTVRCWGNNENGQLGNGSIQPTDELVDPGLTDVLQVTAGGHAFHPSLEPPLGGHTCALLADGTVECWGDNERGQLGDGTRARWRGTPEPVVGLTDVNQVAAGHLHTCAVLDDGTARCWGANDWGQVGDSTNVDRWSPVAVVGLTDVAEIAPGFLHTCARLDDGTAACWGFGLRGQLGDGTSTSSPTPVGVDGLAGATDLVAGREQSCASLETGRVECWGFSHLVGTGGREAPVPNEVIIRPG